MSNYNNSVSENQPNNLDQALQLAGRGWHVFPCKPDKTPYTEHGKDNATKSEGQIKQWWQRWPDALIGIYCERSGFFALDIDIDPEKGIDGKRTWAALCEKFGDVAAGPAQLTPSGGLHILFTLPEGLKVPNNAKKLALEYGGGLDLRSNGYICTGGPYRWLRNHGPEKSITPAPGWLLDLIRAMKAPTKELQKEDKATTGSNDAGAWWLDYYLRKTTGKGNRNDNGFYLACQLRDSGLSESEAEPYILEFARQAPYIASDPYTKKAALASLRSAYSGPARDPARSFVGLGNGNYTTPPEPEAPPLKEEEPPEVKTFADMAGMIGPIEWQWSGWLPKGMLTILAGESGAGKSGLALRLAACFLRGEPWPDGTPFTGQKGAVLWCEAEAAQAVNLDRARAWSLPLDQLYTPLPNPLDDLKLDLEGHRAMLANKAALPEVRLVIIDSLRGVLGRGDENASETLNFIKWLAELARDTQKPVILTHHLRKRSIFDTEGVELERLRGSSAIVQTARVVWALDVPDAGQRDNKRLSVIKSNLSKFPEPVGMAIDDQGVRFGAAPTMPKVETLADRAIDMLLALLAREPRPAAEIQAEFDQAGISIATLKRAKARLGVISVKDAHGWKWALPAIEENIQ